MALLQTAIANGDKVIQDLVEEAATAIGLAVVNIVHLLAPDKIVLGGGSGGSDGRSDGGHSPRDRAKKCHECLSGSVRLWWQRKLGDDAGVLGGMRLGKAGNHKKLPSLILLVL